jgi:hypothetical protein
MFAALLYGDIRGYRNLALILAGALIANLISGLTWCCEAPQGTNLYCIGVAKRDITPPLLKGIFLSGYGLGPARPAAGVAGLIFARAMTIKQGRETVVFSVIDTQGHFIAYQEGRFGAADIRQRVALDRGVPAENIIVASTHDHSAPDDTGIWGGVPNEYLGFITDQTVAAIESAIDNQQPAHLYAAETDVAGKAMLVNVLPSSYPLDTGLQSLVAKDETGRILAILVNFSAHADVLGSHNLMISPDWPGAAISRLEKFAPGSTCLVMLSSAGRSEPDPSDTRYSDLAAAERYGHKVAALAIDSLTGSHPIQGPIAVRQVFIKERTTNQFLRRLNLGGAPEFFESLVEKVLPLKVCVLLHLNVYGTRGVDLILRATSPPYLNSGDVIGTVVSAVRIGDALFAAVPVESFPETRLALLKYVRARDHFLFSLADDQLGYDPPEREAPAVKRFSPDDEALFMTSPKLGDAITRTLIEEARDLGFTVSDLDPSR